MRKNERIVYESDESTPVLRCEIEKGVNVPFIVYRKRYISDLDCYINDVEPAGAETLEIAKEMARFWID